MTDRLTLTAAKTAARKLGMVIKRDPEMGELVVYPKGARNGAEYFTDDVQDALDTARRVAEARAEATEAWADRPVQAECARASVTRDTMRAARVNRARREREREHNTGARVAVFSDGTRDEYKGNRKGKTMTSTRTKRLFDVRTKTGETIGRVRAIDERDALNRAHGYGWQMANAAVIHRPRYTMAW